MVARWLVVRHNDDEFSVEFDTGDGLEVCKGQRKNPLSLIRSPLFPLPLLPFFEEPKDISQKSAGLRRFSNPRSSR